MRCRRKSPVASARPTFECGRAWSVRSLRLSVRLSAASTLVVCSLALLYASTSQAAVFQVTTHVDATDVQPGNGTCAAANGACTLRAAVQESNARPGSDVVHLRRGRYRLTIAGAGENAARRGDLDVTRDLIIIGAGAMLTTVDARLAGDRAFHIRPAALGALSRITVANGHAGQGGGILIEAGSLRLARARIVHNLADDLGGGIFNQGGGVKASDSAFVANTTRDDGGGIAADGPGNTTTLLRSTVSANIAAMDGGGVEIEEGPLVLVDSTVSGNRATGQDGGGIEIDRGSSHASMSATNSAIFNNTTGDNGGGIENDNGSVVLTNTTVSSNTAAAFGGGIDQTDAASALMPSVLTMTNSTINGNVSQGGGGGLSNRMGDTLEARNSLITGNAPQDCGGVVPVTSDGFNLASDSTCNLTQASDLPGTDPRAGPACLQRWTHTHPCAAARQSCDRRGTRRTEHRPAWRAASPSQRSRYGCVRARDLLWVAADHHGSRDTVWHGGERCDPWQHRTRRDRWR